MVGGFASACAFGLLAVFSMIYYHAAAWICIIGLAGSLGIVLWRWLTKEAHLTKPQRIWSSLGLALVVCVLGWILMVQVPLTPPSSIASNSAPLPPPQYIQEKEEPPKLLIEPEPKASSPSASLPTVPKKRRRSPPPVIAKAEVEKEDAPSVPLDIPKPHENIATLLINKYPVTDPAIGRLPDRFIYYWVQIINSVRINRIKPDLQAVMQTMGAPPRQGTSMKELAAEAEFTLRCLASESYIRIKETGARGQWYAEEFDNLGFEFVPEKLTQFVEGL